MAVIVESKRLRSRPAAAGDGWETRARELACTAGAPAPSAAIAAGVDGTWGAAAGIIGASLHRLLRTAVFAPAQHGAAGDLHAWAMHIAAVHAHEPPDSPMATSTPEEERTVREAVQRALAAVLVARLRTDALKDFRRAMADSRRPRPSVEAQGSEAGTGVWAQLGGHVLANAGGNPRGMPRAIADQCCDGCAIIYVAEAGAIAAATIALRDGHIVLAVHVHPSGQPAGLHVVQRAVDKPTCELHVRCAGTAAGAVGGGILSKFWQDLCSSCGRASDGLCSLELKHLDWPSAPATRCMAGRMSWSARLLRLARAFAPTRQ